MGCEMLQMRQALAKAGGSHGRTLEKEPPTVKMLQSKMPTKTMYFRDMRSAEVRWVESRGMRTARPRTRRGEKRAVQADLGSRRLGCTTCRRPQTRWRAGLDGGEE
jgi:hypothetical protein